MRTFAVRPGINSERCLFRVVVLSEERKYLQRLLSPGIHWQSTHIQSVKQVIPWLLALHEQAEVLEYLLFHRNFVVVANRVLTQEVKLHNKFLPLQLLMQLCKTMKHHIPT